MDLNIAKKKLNLTIDKFRSLTIKLITTDFVNYKRNGDNFAIKFIDIYDFLTSKLDVE